MAGRAARPILPRAAAAHTRMSLFGPFRILIRAGDGGPANVHERILRAGIEADRTHGGAMLAAFLNETLDQSRNDGLGIRPDGGQGTDCLVRELSAMDQLDQVRNRRLGLRAEAARVPRGTA